MWRHMVGAVTVALIAAAPAWGAAAQEPSATVRTHQGVAYKVGDPSMELFYTIGEPKEKKEEDKTAPTISVTTSMTAPGGAGDQPTTGEKEVKLLRGHSRASELIVWREGVESRIAWDRVRTLFFTRKPVSAPGLPPYITHYRYAVSVTLMDGERVEADYVNLGAAILRGNTPDGKVDIPGEDVQSVIFER